MVPKEQLLKRLSIIKLLYKIGIEQSKQSEATSFFSILCFHDSIEMFLRLAAEHKGVNAEGLSFIQYWDKIPKLTLKESLRNLNQRRVNIKHKGLIPAKVEIESSGVNTSDFFEQNTPLIFGYKFEEVALIELIKFEKTKESLKEAQVAVDDNKMKDSIQPVTRAFYELLNDYKESKRGHWHSICNRFRCNR